MVAVAGRCCCWEGCMEEEEERAALGVPSPPLPRPWTLALRDFEAKAEVLGEEGMEVVVPLTGFLREEEEDAAMGVTLAVGGR